MPTKRKKNPITGSLLLKSVMPLLLVLCTCVLPSILLYGRNTDLIRFSEIAGGMLITAAIGLVLFVVLLLAVRRPALCGAVVAVAMLFGIKFAWLRYLFLVLLPLPVMTANLLSGVLYVALIVGAWFLFRFLSRRVSVFPQLVSIAAITLLGLLVFNCITSAVSVAKKPVPAAVAGVSAESADQQSEDPLAAVGAIVTETPAVPVESVDVLLPDAPSTDAPSALPTALAPVEEALPNVYFFIFDELGSTSMVEKFYGYDNFAFDDSLRDMGFNISATTHSNSSHTHVCLADLVRLDHYCSNHDLSGGASVYYAKDAALYSAMEGLGYELAQVSTDTNGFFSRLPSLNTAVDPGRQSETGDGETASEYLAGQSILSILLGAGKQQEEQAVDTVQTPAEILASENYANAMDHVQNAVYNLMSVIGYYVSPTSYETTEPRMIFSYVKSPHVPFCLNEYGVVAPDGYTSDWTDPDKYLGQYRYTTSQIQVMVACILEFDPDSIIIIQSDHGIRDHSNGSQPAQYRVGKYDSTHIFNAVYFRGEELDIEGLSAVNTLRLVLSQYGLDYPQIEDPSLAYKPRDDG